MSAPHRHAAPDVTRSTPVLALRVLATASVVVLALAVRDRSRPVHRRRRR
ncbi:hypothetical protein HX744_00430, partial [Pseudonocardia sp. ICBG1122]|nr:hypothetical protein [Pseudonocardia pini]